MYLEEANYNLHAYLPALHNVAVLPSAAEDNPRDVLTFERELQDVLDLLLFVLRIDAAQSTSYLFRDGIAGLLQLRRRRRLLVFIRGVAFFFIRVESVPVSLVDPARSHVFALPMAQMRGKKYNIYIELCIYIFTCGDITESSSLHLDVYIYTLCMYMLYSFYLCIQLLRFLILSKHTKKHRQTRQDK